MSTTTGIDQGTQNVLDNANQHLKDYTNIVRGHDAVHPDRNVCGGVGGCALMYAESETRDELTESIKNLSRRLTDRSLTLTIAATDMAAPAVL